MSQKVDRETQRLTLQAGLDAAKTALERNMLGQFATPTKLAREVLSYGLSLMPREKQIRFLDPAIGTGAFFSALLETIKGKTISAARGYEIDPHYGESSRKFWANTGVQIELNDFTRATPADQGYNLLICNPPYVRHHHLAATEKLRLQEKSREITGLRLSGLAGLYCHFLMLSHQWMCDGAIAGWLIPSEFMDVNYGRELKQYLLKNVTLLRIHRFDPNNVQFDDALVSSAVVWFKKAPPPAGHTVEFTYGGTHSAPIISRRISADELAKEDKWTRFPRQEVRTKTTAPTLSDFFDIKRGVATGNNKFFILSRERIRALGLPMECFRPILPSPRHIVADEVASDAKGNPRLQQSLFLLDCRLPEHEIQNRYPALWRYLQLGKKEIASRYLCRSRKLWYSQEERQSTPFVCTYMGRSDTRAKRPFRFLLNNTRAITANTYLMLYPKPELARHIAEQPKLVRPIWRALNGITTNAFVSEGRVYGGGLHKIEPREMAQLPAMHIKALLKKSGVDVSGNAPELALKFE